MSGGLGLQVKDRTQAHNNAVFICYVPRLSLLGVRWAVGTIQMARIASQSLRVGPPGISFPTQQMTIGGFGDGIYLAALLGCSQKVD